MSQSILVLGASGGIGSAVARRLASQGSQLSLVARSSDELNILAAETNAQAIPADLTDSKAAKNCIDSTVDRWGRLDGVVNCVGSLLLKPAHLTSDEEWANTLDVNLSTSFYVLREAARVMKRQKSGAIIFLTSAAARIGLANHEAIAAAKAGLIGLARAASASYSSAGIRVNCVAPGLVRTPMTARITESPGALKASTALHPLGRIGEPAEIASMICWLLDPEQSWITGQILGVDGGLADLKVMAR